MARGVWRGGLVRGCVGDEPNQFSLLMCGAVLWNRPRTGRSLSVRFILWVMDEGGALNKGHSLLSKRNGRLGCLSVRECFKRNNDRACTHLTSGLVRTNGSKTARSYSDLKATQTAPRFFLALAMAGGPQKINELPPLLFSINNWLWQLNVPRAPPTTGTGSLPALACV